MLHSREACILVLALLALALAGCVTAETPELTLPVITEEPGASPPPYPPPVPTITPLPTGGTSYPPPGQPTPYPPAPTRTPTATPWGVGNLPPLPTYPPPGPFSGMRLIYFDPGQGGFRTIKADGTDELLWPPWDSGTPNQGLIFTSPNGKKILYTVSRGGPDWSGASIWTMNPDGSDHQLLVGAGEDWYPGGAIWSPDGEQIAFKVWQRETIASFKVKELWVMDAAGGNRRLVFSDPDLLKPTDRFYFRWELNGYIYFANGNKQLYAVNPNDGSVYKLMDNVEALDLFFSLATDGVHAANRGAVSVSDLLGAGFTTVELPDHGRAAWSPDGTKIVYQKADRAWLLDVTTGEERLLLSEVDHLYTFSPDGRFVAYDKDEDLFIVDVEDAGATPVLVVASEGPEGLSFFGWIPVP